MSLKGAIAERGAKDILTVECLMNAGFTAEQVGLIAEVLETVCNVCFDAPAGCRCWDDS